ncbi:hypothetical protein DAI22_04g069100 [Oryza sativa Japonica Group]|nr:hypothetical protein DAI22_04g069100 [Oryza sativa Japonica Group]
MTISPTLDLAAIVELPLATQRSPQLSPRNSNLPATSPPRRLLWPRWRPLRSRLRAPRPVSGFDGRQAIHGPRTGGVRRNARAPPPP